MNRISDFCFVLGSLTGLVGMSLGIFMGITHDHSLTPVHVHVNLIGWVGMFLFGFYYKTHPVTESRLAKLQVGAVAIGYVAMTGGLALLILTPIAAALPLAIVGSLLVWLGMAMFVTIVWRTARQAVCGKTLRQSRTAMPS